MVSPSPGQSRLLNLLGLVAAAAALGGIVLAASVVLAKGGPPERGLDLSRLPAQTRQAYEIATTHHDLFVHLPCYCGCAVLTEPHKNLVDCFIQASGEFEPHASSCSTCVDIALEAARAEQEGLDHRQIRALVDELFAGRGPGTETAYP